MRYSQTVWGLTAAQSRWRSACLLLCLALVIGSWSPVGLSGGAPAIPRALPATTQRDTPTETSAPTATALQSACALGVGLPAQVAGTPTLAAAAARSEPVIPVYTYRVVHRYPHDPGAFTEGLVFFNGDLYESTGLLGRSTVRRVDLRTGSVLQRLALGSGFFGEGLTVFQNQLIQLTWQSHLGFVYALNTFDLLRQFSYPGEGWGLTQDGQRLIMSDGSSTLHFLDPVTLAETSHLEVQVTGQGVSLLNELEFVEGEVYANIWKTDCVVRMDPQTGQVVGWIDLTGLLSPPERPSDPDAVLNGIAYDAANRRLFVTGKLWPWLFEIVLVSPGPP